MEMPDLPISDVLAPLIDALRTTGVAVLQAPPGAGKTTVVPLAMLNADLCKGRILMLEPRRLATRAAAERMADTLGEPVGQTVGYRMRGEAKTSPDTRIEIVTEGILTRMIQSDPMLTGIGAVIFDEFHERSLNADLGLALVVESRSALRTDLLLLVMSATLDAGPVAEMLDAPIITSEGRAFPVQTHWLDRPTPRGRWFEDALADLVVQAAEQTSGGILVFLPGEGEIRRVEGKLRARLPEDCTIYPLFGAMDFRAQRAAIAPAKAGRKLVLATAIAETSLTIADISTVVDGGRARRARFDPGSGMSRLITERVTKAEAEQRRGRAGRVGPGQCFRLWTKGEDGGMAPFPPPEIVNGDLCALVLDLALWGARNLDDMAFLSAPNPGAFAGAQALLSDLGALDGAGAITEHGRKIARLPLHPRLAHMLVLGGVGAAELAALLAERDPMRGATVDLLLRQAALKGKHRSGANSAAIARIKQEAKRLAKQAGPRTGPNWAELTALAYPDRIGLRRDGDAPRWILSGGKEAVMQPNDPLASARLIVVTDQDGDTKQARIRQAIALDIAELRHIYSSKIKWMNICHWSKRDRRVVARQQERYGALVLQDRLWNDATPDDIALAVLDGISELGLPMDGACRRFCARVELVRGSGVDLPDMTKNGLMGCLRDWVLPYLNGVQTAADIRALKLLPALQQRLSWEQQKAVDQAAPPHFTTPLQRRIAIDYSGSDPEISLRLQEMFGTTIHPSIAGQPLRITLLSPAGRPLQTTMDIPGFWKTSYSDVRKDMRGRYPKHPWPEDPTQLAPTLRAKPRKP